MLPEESERGLLWSYKGPLEAMSQHRTQSGGTAAAGSTSADGEVRIGLIDLAFVKYCSIGTMCINVAEISMIESELVRENKMNRFLRQQSRSYVTQMITRENPGTTSAEQSPRSSTENILTLCTKKKIDAGS